MVHWRCVFVKLWVSSTSVLSRFLVLENEVHHARAVGSEIAFFVAKWRVSLAPRLLRLVGVVVDTRLH